MGGFLKKEIKIISKKVLQFEKGCAIIANA